MLEEVEAGFRDELSHLGEVFDPPSASEARRSAKDWLWVDDIVSLIDAAAGEERIAAEFHSLRVGILPKLLELRDVFIADVFHVESAPKGNHHHFEAAVGGLIDRPMHRRRVGGG